MQQEQAINASCNSAPKDPSYAARGRTKHLLLFSTHQRIQAMWQKQAATRKLCQSQAAAMPGCVIFCTGLCACTIDSAFPMPSLQRRQRLVLDCCSRVWSPPMYNIHGKNPQSIINHISFGVAVCTHVHKPTHLCAQTAPRRRPPHHLLAP